MAKRVPRQRGIEGTRRKVDPELEKLAQEFTSAKDVEKAAKQAANKAAEKLLSAMAGRGIHAYELEGGGTAVLEDSTKVKVTKPKKKKRTPVRPSAKRLAEVN